MDTLCQFYENIIANFIKELNKIVSKKNRCAGAKGILKRHSLQSIKTYMGEDMIYNECHYECTLCGKKFISMGNNLYEQQKSIREIGE